MNRLIVYPGAIPLDTDPLNAQKYAYYGQGWLAQSAIGTSVAVVGLTIAPTSPASLQVTVAPGAIFTRATVDASAYGSLGTDSNQIVKQGIAPATQTLTLTAPATTGYSINYLVQVALSEVDDTPVTLPYYNASNPSVAWNGPNNTGDAQNTRRYDECVVSLKAGTAAATGSQTTPSPDAGYTGIYVVTVANGQTQITSGDISQLSTAPYFLTLPEISQILNSGVTHGTTIYDTAGSYTYTVPNGVFRIYAEVYGAGGGGGVYTPGVSGSEGEGGGGGGSAEGWISVTPGDTISVVVGAAGVGNTSGTATNGGTSSFGSLSATGGAGGNVNGTPGSGGAGTGGEINLSGQTGVNGDSSYSVYAAFGGDASGPHGGKGSAGVNVPATWPGGGGSASVNKSTYAAALGGAADGGVIIRY